MLNATSRTLSARKVHCRRPLAPRSVAFPAPKPPAPSTRTVVSLCAARRQRWSTSVGSTASALARLPVPITTHPSGASTVYS
jgi:hypothetical protein